MPAKMERCVRKVKAQLGKKYPNKSDKSITSSAWAICNASQNPQESARWFEIDGDYFYFDPIYLKLEEVSAGEIPTADTLYVLQEAVRSMPPGMKERRKKVKAAEEEQDEEEKESEEEEEEEAEEEGISKKTTGHAPGSWHSASERPEEKFNPREAEDEEEEEEAEDEEEEEARRKKVRHSESEEDEQEESEEEEEADSDTDDEEKESEEEEEEESEDEEEEESEDEEEEEAEDESGFPGVKGVKKHNYGKGMDPSHTSAGSSESEEEEEEEAEEEEDEAVKVTKQRARIMKPVVRKKAREQDEEEKEARRPKAKAAESVGDGAAGEKLSEIARRKDVSPAERKAAQKEYGDVQYADEKNKKYPLDAKHVGAAWNYIHQKRNAAKYSPADLARIKSKIARAFKKYRGHAPPKTKESDVRTVYKECLDMTPDGTYSPKQQDVKPGQKKSAKMKTEREAVHPAFNGDTIQHAHQHQHEGYKPHTHKHTHSKHDVVDTMGSFGHMHGHTEGLQPEPAVMGEAAEPGLPGAHLHKHLHVGKIPHAHMHEHIMVHEAIDNGAAHYHMHDEVEEPKLDKRYAQESLREGVATTSSLPTLTRSDMGEEEALPPAEHNHEHLHNGKPHKHPHQHVSDGGTDKYADISTTEHKDHSHGSKESVRTMLFGEPQTLKEAKVNRLKKQIEVTLISPGWSINGRYYSPEALKQAIPVFEGAKCYVNHPTMSEEKERPERSVDDIAGYYTGVRQSANGDLVGTLNIIGVRGENIYPLVVEAAENKQDLIGLSINALGKTRTGEADGRQGIIVDEIVKAFGTDIVTTPSAGGKFDRLMQSGSEITAALIQSLEYDEWRNANAEFLARIKKEMRTLRKDELASVNMQEANGLRERVAVLEGKIGRKNARIKELKEQASELRESLRNRERRYASRLNESIADYKLLASKLPKEWVAPLRESLLGLSPEDMDELIALERSKYFAVKEPVQVFNAGMPMEEDINAIPAEQAEVLGSIGAGHTVVPFEGESPEAYSARKREILGEN